MADIEQIAGELNIAKMYQGEAFSFATIHLGDITADIFDAVIENDDNDIQLAITKTYNSTTLKTTIAYVLSKEKSALLSIGIHQWKMIQTHGGEPRITIKGNWGVYQA